MNSGSDKTTGPAYFKLWMEAWLPQRHQREKVREVARRSGVPIWKVKDYLNGHGANYEDRLALSKFSGLEVDEL